MKLFPVAILAGGLATRLKNITSDTPKSLVRVAGRPFIEHQLLALKSEQVDRVVLCVGHLGEKIERAVGNGSKYGLKIEYSFDGPDLLGTGGALKKALPLLGAAFFVLYGDSYLRIDYTRVQTAFENHRKLGLMTVFHNRDHWDKSNIVMKDNRILYYDKKNPSPDMEYIDYGLNILTRQAFMTTIQRDSFDLAEIMTALAETGELAACETVHRFYEIGSLQGLQETEELIKELNSR